jgi:hypothetical protein
LIEVNQFIDAATSIAGPHERAEAKRLRPQDAGKKEMAKRPNDGAASCLDRFADGRPSFTIVRLAPRYFTFLNTTNVLPGSR